MLKVLIYWLIPFRGIENQRILQYYSRKAFWIKICKPEFFQIVNVKSYSTIVVLFYINFSQIKWHSSTKKVLKSHFWVIFYYFWSRVIFSEKSGSVPYNPTWSPTACWFSISHGPLLGQFLENLGKDQEKDARGWLIRFLNFEYIYTSNFLYRQPCPWSKQYTIVS